MRSPFEWAPWALVSALATTLFSCAPGEPASHASRPELPAPARAADDIGSSVVLVAIDGVRWQDVFLGVDSDLADRYHLAKNERVDAAHLVPNLYRLMTSEGAAIGAPGVGPALEASGPNFISLPGYMEMLTGRSDSGCVSNDCGQVPFSTIADDIARSGLGTAAVITSWAGVGRAATGFAGDDTVVSVGRYEGAGRSALERDPAILRLLADGEDASPEPGHDDFRPDSHTAKIALAVLTTQTPMFLFVGLGETDEYGHRDDYRGYLRALREADATIGKIAETVFRRDRDGHPSTLLVTTDHGRSTAFSSHGQEHPESSRVWLIAAGAAIRARGWVPSDEPRRLSDLSQTIRAVVGLPLVRAPRAGHVLSELLMPSSLANRTL